MLIDKTSGLCSCPLCGKQSTRPERVFRKSDRYQQCPGCLRWSSLYDWRFCGAPPSAKLGQKDFRLHRDTWILEREELPDPYIVPNGSTSCCPSCHTVSPRSQHVQIVQGKHPRWKCPNCREGFTSDEWADANPGDCDDGTLEPSRPEEPEDEPVDVMAAWIPVQPPSLENSYSYKGISDEFPFRGIDRSECVAETKLADVPGLCGAGTLERRQILVTCQSDEDGDI